MIGAGQWTRSLQRVEGVSLVVDMRPTGSDGDRLRPYVRLEGDSTGLAIYQGVNDPARMPDMSERTHALRARRRLLGDVWPANAGLAITVRIDSDLRFGVNDCVDLIARAIRAHLAGVSVEVMS